MNISNTFFNLRFRRQLDKLIDFCLQMADLNTSNDDKQLIELKLVNLIHAVAIRTFFSITKNKKLFNELSSALGCLPNPDKNESVLKAFAIYAIKNHKQSLVNNTESSILSIFKQAISDGIKSKECYALAVY